MAVNGLYAALGPRSEQDETFSLLEFRATEFRGNYENLKAITDAIWAKFPTKKIVLTVSPVALAETWTDEDVVRANLQSKATLRAAVGQLCRELPRITYWPSFEFAMVGDVFKEDGRHVKASAVEEIVSGFLHTYSA